MFIDHLIYFAVVLIIVHTTKSAESYLEDEYTPVKQESSPMSSLDDDYDTSNIEEATTVASEKDTNVTIIWDNLSWKILCDEDEWRSQFRRIRDNFTRKKYVACSCLLSN